MDACARNRWLAAAAVMVVGLAHPAQGQQFRRVDEGVADLDPLSTSMRLELVDLRLPMGFEDLYQVSTPAGDSFVRIDGGLYAVFPRSLYAGTERGPVAIIPPGTVFHIGGIGKESLVEFPLIETPAFNRVDLRVDGRAAQAADKPQSEPVSLFLTEGSRQARIEELLRAAARAEKSRSGIRAGIPSKNGAE